MGPKKVLKLVGSGPSTPADNDVESTFKLPDLSDPDKVLKSINEKLNIIIEVCEEIKAINVILSAFDELQRKVTLLELKVVEKDCVINNLSERLNALEQYGRNKNVELINVVKLSDNERVEDIVINVAQSLGVQLEKSDIEAAHRLPSRGSDNRPEKIIVQLSSRKKREEFVSSRRKVVDVDTGKNVGPNCEGELCFKTPVKLKGYRGNPEATRQLFDDEGFIKSGDIGYCDEDGYFFIIDRLKQLIKYKNIQVPAIDIEEVLLHHDDVKEAAVVGIQNEVDTEHATAFVVRQPGATVTAQDLVKLVEGKLPKFKWLYGGVVFMESLPKTGSGKVQQRVLKAMHASRSS